MDSGKEHELDNNIENFTASIKNQIGITINGFIEIEEGLVINPSHISSIEEIEDKIDVTESIIEVGQHLPIGVYNDVKIPLENNHIIKPDFN